MRAYVEKRIWLDGNGVKREAWRARYDAPGPDGRIRLKSETPKGKATKAAATALLHKRIAELQSGTYAVDVTMTLDELWQRYAAVHETRISQATARVQADAYKRLPEWLRRRPLGDITRLAVQGAFDELSAAGLAPGTIRISRQVLRATLRQGMRWDLVSRDLTDGLILPSVPIHAGHAWNVNEARRFLEVNGDDPKYGLLWTILLLGGLRIGEALALRWSDCDTEAGTIHVHRTLTSNRQGKRKIIREGAKTVAGNRIVPVMNDVADAIEDAMPDIGRDTLMFPNAHGEPTNPDTVTRALTRACERAGLPRATAHDLRRTWATLMRQAGVPSEVVAALAGHSTVSLVLDRYARSLPDAERAAARVLSQSLNATTLPPETPLTKRPAPTTRPSAPKPMQKRRKSAS